MGGANSTASSYHSLVLGLIYGLSDTHWVFSGRLETGLGFSDLLIIPREQTRNSQAILMEFKHTRANETDEQAADKALEQIDKLQYGVEIRKYPYIATLLKVGMAFMGKSLTYKSTLIKVNIAEETMDSIHKKAKLQNDDDDDDSDDQLKQPRRFSTFKM